MTGKQAAQSLPGSLGSASCFPSLPTFSPAVYNFSHQLSWDHVDWDPLYLRDIKTLGTSEKTILIFLLQSPDSGEAEAVFAESQQGFSN